MMPPRTKQRTRGGAQFLDMDLHRAASEASIHMPARGDSHTNSVALPGPTSQVPLATCVHMPTRGESCAIPLFLFVLTRFGLAATTARFCGRVLEVYTLDYINVYVLIDFFVHIIVYILVCIQHKCIHSFESLF